MVTSYGPIVEWLGLSAARVITAPIAEVLAAMKRNERAELRRTTSAARASSYLWATATVEGTATCSFAADAAGVQSGDQPGSWSSRDHVFVLDAGVLPRAQRARRLEVTW